MDEKFINFLKRIKYQCQQHAVCENCIMHSKKDLEHSLVGCKIMEMAFVLSEMMEDIPERWDIDKIEEVLKDEKDT